MVKIQHSRKETRIQKDKSTCQSRRIVDWENSDLEEKALTHCERQWKVQSIGAFDLHLEYEAVHDVLVSVVQVAELVPLQVLKGENSPANQCCDSIVKLHFHFQEIIKYLQKINQMFRNSKKNSNLRLLPFPKESSPWRGSSIRWKRTPPVS